MGQSASASKLQLQEQLNNISNYERILQIHQNLKHSKHAWAKRSATQEKTLSEEEDELSESLMPNILKIMDSRDSNEF